MAKIKLWAVVPVEIEVYDKLTPSKLKEGKKIAAQCITNTSICGSVSAKTKGKVVFYDHKPEKVVFIDRGGKGKGLENLEFLTKKEHDKKAKQLLNL